MSRVLILLALSILTLLPIRATATHVRAVDLQVERICGTQTFRVRIIAYLNSSSRSPFGSNTELFFGDGSVFRVTAQTAVLRPDLGTNVSVAIVETTHTYATPGIYKIALIERDRSSNILNIANSDDVPYVTLIEINTSAEFGCNRYPTLTVVPLDRGCSKATFTHNSGAVDADGDSLSYSLSIPSRSPNEFAPYVPPNSPRFYPNFNAGNEEENGPPSFQIDPLTGTLTWDAPGAIGEYNLAFIVTEWRKDPATGVYRKISATTRDMQVIIEDCPNTRPELEVPQDICVIAGESISGSFAGRDLDGHPVKIEVFSQLLTLDNSPAILQPDVPSFVPSIPSAITTFRWNTNCTHVRQQPYQVVVKITDKPAEGPRLVTFRTWNIRVVAPPPVWETVALDVVKLEGRLSWEEFACNNVTQFQIWRKVGSFAALSDKCKTGMIPNSGYQLIDLVSGDTRSYVDTNGGKGLSPGAIYCYRIVALVADSKSMVSEERCIGPVKADAPVITHVTVDKTAEDGQITISWRRPPDINKVQFPEPYQYEVYRAVDFFGDEQIQLMESTTDTTFADQAVHTRDSVVNYRIVLYSKPQFSTSFVPVDTSASASIEKLMGVAGVDQISLNWRDSVPWSNVVEANPWHRIYRKEGLATNDNELLLYDSVNVTENSFRYVDVRVDRNKIYSYKIMTRGTYGNPDIPLQENFSQVISLYPDNDLLPCAPNASIERTNCEQFTEQYSCGEINFSNKLSWQSPENDCRIDIDYYEIFSGDAINGDYTLLATVRASSFEHSGLSSFARCYRIRAIDTRGIAGPLSEPVCNENCPNFLLPNVFSPNGDGCNDLFTSRYNISVGPDSPCPPSNPDQCPRFVKRVDIIIYNRWGKIVFTQSGGNTEKVFIDWDGRDQNNNELSTGVYYYVADVDFDMLAPEARTRQYRGWIHLIR